MLKSTPTSKNRPRSSIFERSQDTPGYIHGISLGAQCDYYYRVYKRKLPICMLKSTPMTSKYRSRSSIFKLNKDTPRIHPWYKFSPNAINICCVIVFTSEMLTNGRTDRQTDRQARQSNSRLGYTQPTKNRKILFKWKDFLFK